MKISAGALIVALLLGSVSISSVAAGDKPPALLLKDMEGHKTRLADLRGSIVVLNFWATWCGPCNVEMPLLVKAAQAYREKHVVFVGVSVDDNTSVRKIPGFLAARQVSYPIWTGATDEDMKRLEMGGMVPGTAFLDEDGVIRARVLGQLQPGELEERIDWLLRGRDGKAPALLVKHLDEK